MLKLYRATERGTEYWEAWANASEITIHWGKLGEEGDNREIPLKPGINPNDIIKSEAKPEPQGSSRWSVHSFALSSSSTKLKVMEAPLIWIEESRLRNL